MSDFAKSIELEDRLLERPLHETPSTSAKVRCRPVPCRFLSPSFDFQAIPISTRYGYVLVTQQGPADRQVIVTYHDVGYNCTIR